MKDTKQLPKTSRLPVVALPKELLRNPVTTDRAFRFMVTLITMAKKKARTIEVTQDKLAEAMQCTTSTVYRAMKEAEKFYGLKTERWTTPDKKQHIRYEIPRFRGGLTYVQKQVVYGLKSDCDLRTYLVLKSAEFKVSSKYVRRSTVWLAKMLGLSGVKAEQTALKRIRRLGALITPRHTGQRISAGGVVQVSLYDERKDLTEILQGASQSTSDDRYTTEPQVPQMTDISTLSNDKKEKDRQLQEEDLQASVADEGLEAQVVESTATDGVWPQTRRPGGHVDGIRGMEPHWGKQGLQTVKTEPKKEERKERGLSLAERCIRNAGQKQEEAMRLLAEDQAENVVRLSDWAV